MVTTNGYAHPERSDAPSSHLGKRKRTRSPSVEATDTKNSALHEGLESALEAMQQVDSTKAILNRPLPSELSDVQLAKKRRTQIPNAGDDTIETRIKDKTYVSVDEVLSDLRSIGQELNSTVMAGRHTGNHVVGKEQNEQKERLEAILLQLQRQLEQHQSDTNPSRGISRQDISATGQGSQLVSVRMHLDGMTRQLFTGLGQAASITSSDARTLPNGFELAELVSVIGSDSTPKQRAISDSRRTFGEVFAPAKAVKALEPPLRANTQGGTISFVSQLSSGTLNRASEYTCVQLETGAWLRYGVLAAKSNKSISETDAVIAQENALFQAAFSSFAPSIDQSKSAISEAERARHWFDRHARPNQVFEEAETDNQEVSSTEAQLETEVASDFESIIANYISEAEMDDRDEGTKILEEISEMIQTLSSYQIIRDLDSYSTIDPATKVSGEEKEIYELLRTQLQLLIDCLPPYALSKLNGEQLAALNISTHIQVQIPEVTGTGQADEYTLRRQRAAQAAANVAARPTVPATSRQAYGTPNTAYNAQAQMYNKSVNTSAYAGPRPGGSMYNTPRAAPVPSAQYSQQAYRSAVPGAYSTPSAPGFQHPVSNGYTQSAQTPYTQRPSQPGYQQRAQDRGTAWVRSDTPQKPMLNGQTPQQYQPRPAVAQSTYSSSNVTPQQRALEQIKMQQQQHTVQQQASAASQSNAAETPIPT